MMKNLVSFLNIIAACSVVLAGCAQLSPLPPQGLLPPEVTQVEAEPGYDSAVITATIERAEQITEGGFYLWSEGEDKNRIMGTVKDSVLRCDVAGLHHLTNYECIAFVSNGKEEILSKVYRFRTLDTPFSIDITTSATASTYSATLSATITSNKPLDGCGFVLWEDGNDRRIFPCNLDNGTIYYQADDLEPSTLYYWASYYTWLGETFETTPQSFNTAQQPKVISVAVDSDYDSASLSAYIERAEQVIRGGFYIWNGDEGYRKEEGTISGSELKCEVTDLQPLTHYSCTAFITDVRGEILSEQYSISTKDTPFTIEITYDVVPNTTSAILSATITSNKSLDECGFFLWQDGQDKVRIPRGLADGKIDYTANNLQAYTNYYYSVYYIKDGELTETEATIFRTLPLPPDPAIWNYLLANYDTDGDGQMSNSELGAITELILSDILLESQSGLEMLPNLISLSMGNNWLEVIDLSVCPKLEFFSGGRSPHWKELIIDNSELWQLYIIYADNLKTIDLSKCPKLSTCQLYNDGIEALDFSTNTDLETLMFSETKLKELDLSKNWKLNHLHSTNNPDLKVIWLKQGIIMNSLEVDEHTEIKYK